MDFPTTAHTVAGQLANVSSEQEPLVRAAMQLAIQPWLHGTHTGAQVLYWGEFAAEIQDAEASWWLDPRQHALPTVPANTGPDTIEAAAALAEAIAAVFDRAADATSGPAAWQRAATATQLRDAASDLRDRPGSNT